MSQPVPSKPGSMNRTEKRRLKQALHDMNNALNAISMQTELAQVYSERGDDALAQAALRVVMTECRRCSSISHSVQSEFLVESP